MLIPDSYKLVGGYMDLDKKIGVLLTRAQVFTTAHLGLVQLILEENDYACIVIGSADKCGTERNPFDIKFRLSLLNVALSDFTDEDKNRIIIFSLNDWLGEENTDSLYQWGHYLYYNIVANIDNKRFSFYYSDGEDILDKWFDGEVRPYITYVCKNRNELFEEISATKVRELLKKERFEQAKKYLPGREYLYMYDMSKRLNLISGSGCV